MLDSLSLKTIKVTLAFLEMKSAEQVKGRFEVVSGSLHILERYASKKWLCILDFGFDW